MSVEIASNVQKRPRQNIADRRLRNVLFTSSSVSILESMEEAFRKFLCGAYSIKLLLVRMGSNIREPIRDIKSPMK